MRKVLITTGGTGGHIYPALSVAKTLKNKGVEILFVGSTYRMEKDIIPANGFRYIGLSIKPLRKISSVYKMIVAIFKSLKILKNEKPDAIIGFGNYISVPILLAGLIKGIKIYLHEQNVEMGLANKLFYRFARKIFLSFEETFDMIPLKYSKKFIVTGNPIREEFYHINPKEEREKLKLEKDEKMVLIIGGSLGAQSINEAVLKNWDRFFKEKKIRVYWATGKENFEFINSKISKMKNNDVIKPYFDNAPILIAVSDVIFCRAGASTISEIIQMQKPSILIPYNHVGQKENAEVLVKNEAALIFSDNKAEEGIKEIFEIIKAPDRLKNMTDNLKKLKKGNAAEKLIEELEIWGN